MNGFLTLVYNGLFHPQTTYEKMAETEEPGRNLLYGLILVFLISAIAPPLHTMQSGATDDNLLLIMPLHGFLGLLGWVLMASVIALMAFAFRGHGRFKPFLLLSSLATLPWILLAPALLIENSLGATGSFLGICLSMGLWAWSAILFGMAVARTYALNVEQTLSVLVMPFLMFGVFIAWTAGFMKNIIQIFGS
ncbi:MAG: Yip1 family protein [Candidatus Melainabacteria bacterium]